MFLSVFYFLMFSPASFAVGGATSNGGDSIAAEFTKMGRQVAEILRTQKDFPVKSEQFSRAIAKTWVVSKKRTLLHGQEMEALNFPGERRIEINRMRWLENKNSQRSRYVLVAHEYFGILKIDDRRYQLSEKLFAVPGVARNTIRCQAFTDGALNLDPLESQYFLELNTYDTQAIALIKNKKGIPLLLAGLGVGDTLITGTLSEKENSEKSVKAIVTVNLGFAVRMIQLDIGRTSSGKFTAKRWDVKADAQVSSLAEVECEQTNW